MLQVAVTPASQAGALEEYVQRPDPSFAWKAVEQKQQAGFTITRLDVTSQTWHDLRWTHTMQIGHPAKVRNPGVALLVIAGSGDGSSSFNLMKTVSEQAGILVAVVANVPNQPLFNGRNEDALIAYTFDQYLKTGDETWPLLLPMVKSAVRAMDAVQAYAQAEYGQKVEKFVVTGVSKRGWTTWLSAAADPRVAAIAPAVIDMLNMKAQTEWTQKVYGRQSEKIRAYTDLKLVEKMDTPQMVALRGLVDPYSYRRNYRLPKLILLGTNDPFWTVEALKHYWYDLPGPKLVYQAPNTGHAQTAESIQTMAAVFQMVADGKELPTVEWQFSGADHRNVTVTASQQAKAARLWTAESATHDFRKATWSSQALPVTRDGREAAAAVQLPASGYRAYMVELTLTASTGADYKVSTQVQVVPENVQ